MSPCPARSPAAAQVDVAGALALPHLLTCYPPPALSSRFFGLTDPSGPPRLPGRLAGSGQAPEARTAGCGNGVNTCCSPLGLSKIPSVRNVRPHAPLACLRCPRPPRRRAGAVAARVGCRAAGAAWRRAAGRSGGRLAAHAACDQLGPGGASAEWRSADAGPAAAADRWGGRAGGRAAGVGCRRRRGCCCFIATLPPLWR